MGSNSYDNIANEYRDSKQLDFRKYIEEYTLHQLLGEATGLNILDVACGEGIYTRKLKKRGAATILGVDVSTRMIELAQEAEAKAPLGCDYLVQDALTMNLGRQFDAVVGMYLLRLPLEITFSKNIFKKSTQLGVDFLLKNCRIIKIILFYTTSVSLF